MKRLTIVVCALAVAVPALAQMSGPPPQDRGVVGVDALHPEDDHPRAMEAVSAFLGLDEGQVAQWNDLVATLRGTVEPLRAEQREVADELAALLEESAPEPAAVGALVLAGKELREQVGEAYRVYNEAFATVLTPEQADRLGAVRRADRLQPVLPAFRLTGLLPPR